MYLLKIEVYLILGTHGPLPDFLDKLNQQKKNLRNCYKLIIVTSNDGMRLLFYPKYSEYIKKF